MTAAPVTESATETGAFSRSYRAWFLFMLVLITALNLADRQGMAISAPAIKHDLLLSDAQLGLLLGLAFAIFFALMALPVARLAEHRNRVRIVGTAVAVFAAACAACGVAQSFWQMILFRIGVGSGDAGSLPPVASLVGDHYPAGKRASVNSIVWLGAPVGAVAGSVLGGMFVQGPGWRAWFFALGAVSLTVAIVAFLTLREPPRGMSDPVAAKGPPPSMGTVVKFLWAKKSVRQVLIGAGIASMGLNGLGQFFARYFIANFHLPPAEVGGIMGAMVTVAMTSGLLLGGFGVDWLSRVDRRWAVWGPAIALVIAAPLMAAGVAQATVTAAVPVLIAGHVALFVYWTPTLAIGMNMVCANMRASAAFVMNLVLGLVGIGLGPTLTGLFSDLYANARLPGFGANCPGGLAPKGAADALVQSCADASATGVRCAIVTMSLFFVWAAVHYTLAARDLRKDLDTHYSA